MFLAVKQLAKRTELTTQRIVFIKDEFRTFRKVNETFAKRRKTKRMRLQAGDAFTTKDTEALIVAKIINSQESKEGLCHSTRPIRFRTRVESHLVHRRTSGKSLYISLDCIFNSFPSSLYNNRVFFPSSRSKT